MYYNLKIKLSFPFKWYCKLNSNHIVIRLPFGGVTATLVLLELGQLWINISLSYDLKM